MSTYELNARPLTNEEVGTKFVLHPEFFDLARSKNSLIVGPRGSGKTTMLKMLTPEAQYHWEPESEEEHIIAQSLNFIGIYIPMSRIFQDDLEVRYKVSKLPRDEKDNLLQKIYFLNIIESILSQVYFFIDQKKWAAEDIINLCERFNKLLELNVKYCYKVTSILTAISILKLNARKQLINNEYKENTQFYGEIISNIEPVLSLMNELFDFPPDQKYALCFDELDVYASEFTADMIKSLRGVSTNILLKLALAPIHTVSVKDFLDPPSQTHDFDRIYLWPSPEISGRTRYQEETRYLNFTERLAIQTFKELLNINVDINQLLGAYSYQKVLELMMLSESDNNMLMGKNLKKYSDSMIESLIFELYSISDYKFKFYLLDQLKKSKIEIKSLPRKNKSETIRKLKPIVFNRLVCTKLRGDKRVFKRQKVPYQYHGKKIILKCLDGNPRYLKKLVEYLSEYIDPKSSDIKTISISNQARALVNVKNLFMQRIFSIPLNGVKEKYSTGNLISEIGKYLSKEMNLRVKWNSSFPSYIKVPNIKEVSAYEDSFKKAINNGALLIVDDYDLERLNSIKHKSLRLNYLLHIEFLLPIRKYYSTSFENIINIVPATNTLFDNDRNTK